MKHFFLFLIISLITCKSYSLSVLDKNYTKEERSYSTVLRQIDHVILASKDSVRIDEHLRPISEEIVVYSREVYDLDLSDMNVQGVILAAITLMPFEERDRLIATGIPPEEASLTAGETWDCMVEAIGTVMGIGGMIADIRSMWVNGASVSTVSRVVWRIFRQYLGWWLAVEATYSFGKCMGWWGS